MTHVTITGARAFGDDVPDSVLDAAARYAVAAAVLGLSTDDMEDDIMECWPGLLDDCAVEVVGAELHVALAPR